MSDLQKRESGLCNICTTVSFKGLFAQDYGPSYGDEWDAGYSELTIPSRTLAHLKSSPFCKCCRLTLVALGISLDDPVGANDESQEVECVSPGLSGTVIARDSFGKRDEKRKEAMRPARKFYFHIKLSPDWREITHNIQECYTDTTTTLAMGACLPQDEDLFSGRLMGDTISVDMLRLWLERSPAEELPSGRGVFRTNFIDIRDRKIVEKSCDCTFAALSYVWGGATQVMLNEKTRPLLFSPGGLNEVASALPRSITDAISLCEKIGFDYLWIDSLCIQQDDKESIATQISRMDFIYESANLTIVNASADPATNADSPIPGFSPGSRSIHQQEELIYGVRIILTKRPPFELAIRKSVFFHNRRSDNCSFFCEDTVFENEDRTLEIFCRHIPTFYLFDWDHDSISMNTFTTRAEKLLYIIWEYTRRNLTRQEDTLAAIEALLSSFELDLGEPFFGIPRKIFDYGLCWSPAGSVFSRRVQFPSWSWAGWQGAISFLDEMDTKMSRGNPFGDWISKFEQGHVEGEAVLNPAAGKSRYRALAPHLQGLGFFSQNVNTERKEVPLAPHAVTHSVIDEYYQRILGHQRQTGLSVSNRGYLHFMAYSITVYISSIEKKGPSPDLKESERSDAFYDIEIPGHKAITWDERKSLSIVKSWRKQQPDDLVVEFILVYAGWEQRLVPIEWETVRACEHCNVRHQVARRIGQVSVIETISGDGKDSLSSFYCEKFVILG